jgi:hypothetical protein
MTVSYQPHATPPSQSAFSSGIAKTILLGMIPLVFTLNGVLGFVSRHTTDVAWVSMLLEYLSKLPNLIYTTILPLNQYFWFALLIHWIFWSLAIHLLLASLASLRHGTPRFILSSLFGFSTGLFIITWLSWLLWLAVIIYAIVAAVGEFVSMVIRTLLIFLITPPVLYLTLLLLLIVVALMVYSVISMRSRNPIDWRRMLKISGIAVVAVLLTLLLVRFAFAPLWQDVIQPILAGLARWWIEWAVPTIGAIFGFLAKLVIYLVGFVIALVVMFILGRQIAEQIGSPIGTGLRTCGFFDTGFGIGASLALIMLVCFANPVYANLINQAWAMTTPIGRDMDLVRVFHSFVPERTAVLLRNVLNGSSLPLFDSLMVFIAMFLANCSVLTGIFDRIDPEPLRRIIARDRQPILLMTVGGTLLALAATMIDRDASQN